MGLSAENTSPAWMRARCLTGKLTATLRSSKQYLRQFSIHATINRTKFGLSGIVEIKRQ